jgi:hypothetical protein
MKSERRVIPFGVCIFILLCISNVCAGIATPIIPHGWRVPTSAELQDPNDAWRKKDKNGYLKVESDFNGDGVIDEAKLLIYKKNGSRLALFAFVSQEDGSFKPFLLIEISDDPSNFRRLGIEKVSGGTYLTACGKGITDCGPGEPDKVIILYNGINFFQEDGASMYFYWDPAMKDFKKAYIDD